MAKRTFTQYKSCRGGVLSTGTGVQEAARGERALQQPGRSCVFRGSGHAESFVAVYGVDRST